MLELEICGSKDLEEDIEYADKFRREVRAPRIQATQRLVDMAKDESQPRLSESGSASVDSSCNVNVRLPKLELPKFNGVLTEWQSFWDRFVALVDDSDIPTIGKFCNLQSLLKGEARAVIQGLSQTSVNYPIAYNMLKERFGKPERIIFAHIQALLSVALPTKIAPGSSKHMSSLWKLQDELLTHARSLEALGVDGKQYGREIERRERSDTFKDIHAGKSDNRFVKSKKRGKFQSSASALQTSSELADDYMNSRHVNVDILVEPVVRESSNSTKVRPVFDASAVGYNGISLNDCLECGPSLNPDLVGVLIKFRRWKVALTADITKAFLQIKVRREDQDVHRFLWNCDDDWLSGADSDAEACVKFNEASKIMAEAGLLRIKGRLEYSDLCYESKHPIILPPSHIVKALVHFQHVLLKHAGVSTLMSTLRNSYWIVRLRRLAKAVCRECASCRRQDSKACRQPVAPLPELRVKSAPPFTVTGLDYAGPLFCADMPLKKLYILLFTCAAVRSVHLELTDSLSLPDCLLAIRRFTSRRTIPSTFYSDNAKTFASACHVLQQHYGPLALQWKFIVARGPWWGG
ncbi:uncharacterized protein [Palaemon carinicauda]|uniref:uncharacterized protein n=1 Tax=Palaemon carinicauda TaxID=392227 RepID=UPI0035B5D31D